MFRWVGVLSGLEGAGVRRILGLLEKEGGKKRDSVREREGEEKKEKARGRGNEKERREDCFIAAKIADRNSTQPL